MRTFSRKTGYLIGGLALGFFWLGPIISCVGNPSRPADVSPVFVPSGVVVPASASGSALTSPAGVEESAGTAKMENARLSLARCIQIALENNRQLLIAEEGRVKAKGRVTESMSQCYPNLTANLSYRRVDQVTDFSASALTPKITIGSLDNYSAEASLKQTIYQGGRVNAMIESAQLGQQLAEMQFRDAKEAVIFLVTKAYDDVLLSQETLNINQKSLVNAQEHLNNVRLSHQQGVASNYELLRAEVQVTNLKAVVIQSESNLHLAKLSLLRAMGAPVEDGSVTIELTDPLTPTIQSVNLAQALETAFQLRPDLQQARLAVEMQKKNITIAKSDLRPNISLLAATGEEKPSRYGFGENVWGDYWNAGIAISFPLFEGGRVRGQVIQERATLHQNEISLDDTAERVRYEVKQAVLSLNDTAELIKSQSENVRQAEEGLRLVDLGFKNGVNTQLEVLDTQVSLDVARKNYLTAVYNYNLAHLMLEKSMGVLENKP